LTRIKSSLRNFGNHRTGNFSRRSKIKSLFDVQKIARDVINKIGYTKGEYMFDGSSCGVLSAIHEQSPDINQGVDRKAKKSKVPATRV
jgi:S-adenosylmethionine synthetase